MKRVFVKWVDTYERNGWMLKEDAVKHSKDKMICRTSGYLLDLDDEHIVICHTYNKTSVMGSLHIPRQCIKKLKSI